MHVELQIYSGYTMKRLLLPLTQAAIANCMLI